GRGGEAAARYGAHRRVEPRAAALAADLRELAREPRLSPRRLRDRGRSRVPVPEVPGLRRPARGRRALPRDPRRAPTARRRLSPPAGLGGARRRAPPRLSLSLAWTGAVFHLSELQAAL